jgi:hypothetical protein
MSPRWKDPDGPGAFRRFGDTASCATEAAWKLKTMLVESQRISAPTNDSKTAQAVAAELKVSAQALTTVESGHLYPDLAAFGKAVGDARIVALGEATHGTREFFQMKHHHASTTASGRAWSTAADVSTAAIGAILCDPASCCTLAMAARSPSSVFRASWAATWKSASSERAERPPGDELAPPGPGIIPAAASKIESVAQLRRV